MKQSETNKCYSCVYSKFNPMPGAIENRMDVYCKLDRKWVMRRNECSGWSNEVYDNRFPEKILVKAKFLFDIARILSILDEKFSVECTDEVASESDPSIHRNG